MIERRRRAVQVVVPVSGADTLILESNPHRRSILLSNSGPGAVLISLGRPASAQSGVYIPPAYPATFFDRAQWGALVGMELHGFAVGLVQAGGLAVSSATVSGHNLSTASVGAILTYTVPAGVTAVVTEAFCALTAGTAPTVKLEYTPSGGATQLASGNIAGGTINLVNAVMGPGDKMQMVVTVAGSGSTVDAQMYVQQYSSSGGGTGSASGTVTVWYTESEHVRRARY